mmetsp:Transcript_16151/g.25590  ORF Transcript_16151/g.25590 Transcript_16151/m.25590 type:complete len:104 (+) Transcript_16151:42-353(+)
MAYFSTRPRFYLGNTSLKTANPIANSPSTMASMYAKTSMAPRAHRNQCSFKIIAAKGVLKPTQPTPGNKVVTKATIITTQRHIHSSRPPGNSVSKMSEITLSG